MNVAEELARLASMSPSELRVHWPKLWGAAAPRWSPDLLRLGLAWKVQEQAYGGLKGSTLRQLRKIAGGATRTG